YGSVHHRSPAWAMFVLPVVLVLVGLSLVYRGGGGEFGAWFSAEHFLGAVQGILVLAGSVGITGGVLERVMYIVQATGVRMKRPPLGGLRLLSLERLETMSRRAITLAFPLLTVGLLLGAMRMPFMESPATGWTDPKVLGTIGLWIVAFVLLY